MEAKIKESKQKFPKSIIFVLINTFLERYSTTATSAILLLYFNTKLGFDQSSSTALFHVNQFLINFFSIFGAIVADSHWGLFKTLSIMSLVFAIGSGVISISGIESLNLPIVPLTFTGLFIFVLASGSFRSNLSSFGAHQFNIPEQSKLLKCFFSTQLLFLNFGTLFGAIGNPLLRDSVKCFGMDDCYPLAFGTSSIAMILALIILLCGKSFYTHKKPSENAFLKFCGCVLCGIKGKLIKRSKNEDKNHWLDYACVKYDQKMIDDSKKVLNILTVFTPIPIYWALYMQQSSKWIFQATQMNLDLGWFTVKPDQIIALNPIFSIIFIVISDCCLNSVSARLNIYCSLHKIAMGGFFCCLAFVTSLFLELEIQTRSVSILWILPQFAIISLSEKCVFPSLLNFSFTKAPINMKSVMTACVFMTIALGNLIVTAISGLKLFSSQVYEFLFYIIFLFIAMIVFLLIAINYRSTRENAKDDIDIENNSDTIL